MMLDFIKNLFSKKQQNIRGVEITNSIVMQVGGNLILDSELSQLLNIYKNDKSFLNQLIKEKLEYSRNIIIEGKSKDASLIIDTIYVACLKSINDENENTLNYLKALLCVLEGDISQTESLIGFIDTNCLYRNNIITSISIEKYGIADLIITDEVKEDHLFSYIILQILFKRMEYDYIIANFTPTDNSFHVQDYFYGLASLNKHNFVEAIRELDNANTKKPEPKYIFCKALGKINLNISQIEETDLNLDLINSQYQDLIDCGNICREFRDSNLIIFNMTKLRTLLILKSELFLYEYSKLPQ
jgi:hypothetical protein